MGSCSEEMYIVECIVSKTMVKNLDGCLVSEHTSMVELCAFMKHCTDIYSNLPIDKFENVFKELEGEISYAANLGDRYSSMSVLRRTSFKFAKVSIQTQIIDNTF